MNELIGIFDHIKKMVLKIYLIYVLYVKCFDYAFESQIINLWEIEIYKSNGL